MQVKVYQQLFLIDGRMHQRSVDAIINCSLHDICTRRFNDVCAEVKELSIEEGLARRSQVSYDRTLIVIDGGKK